MAEAQLRLQQQLLACQDEKARLEARVHGLEVLLQLGSEDVEQLKQLEEAARRQRDELREQLESAMRSKRQRGAEYAASQGELAGLKQQLGSCQAALHACRTELAKEQQEAERRRSSGGSHPPGQQQQQQQQVQEGLPAGGAAGGGARSAAEEPAPASGEAPAPMFAMVCFGGGDHQSYSLIVQSAPLAPLRVQRALRRQPQAARAPALQGPRLR